MSAMHSHSGGRSEDSLRLWCLERFSVGMAGGGWRNVIGEWKAGIRGGPRWIVLATVNRGGVGNRLANRQSIKGGRRVKARGRANGSSAVPFGLPSDHESHYPGGSIPKEIQETSNVVGSWPNTVAIIGIRLVMLVTEYRGHFTLLTAGRRPRREWE